VLAFPRVGIVLFVFGWLLAVSAMVLAVRNLSIAARN
jgi:hypothetical protein